VRALPLAAGRNEGGHYLRSMIGPSGVRALPLAAGINKVGHYCQAQPKPQFNWGELALLSHFDLNLLILLWFLSRESIGLSHFALKLNQISFLSLVHDCLPNGTTTP
jgi:hypothetical protein